MLKFFAVAKDAVFLFYHVRSEIKELMLNLFIKDDYIQYGEYDGISMKCLSMPGGGF